MRSLTLFGLVFLLCSVSGTITRGAEFDINGPAVELRRIQFCETCGHPLLVTTVPAGAAIRCPHCSSVQRRFPTRNLLVRVYQVCPHCGVRMDVSKYQPDDTIRCGGCGHRQYVLAEAVYQSPAGSGTGRMKDAPSVDALDMPQEQNWTSSAKSRRDRNTNEAVETPQQKRNARIAATRKHVSALEDEDMSPLLVAPGVFDDTRAERLRQSTPGTQDKTNGTAAITEDTKLLVTPDMFENGLGSVTKALDDSPLVRVPNDRTVATVNDKPIYESDLQALLDQAMDEARMRLGRAGMTPRGKQLLRQKRAELRDKMLDTLIDRAVVLQAAPREGIKPSHQAVLQQAERLRAERGMVVDDRQILEQARIDLALGAAIRKHAADTPEPAPAELHAYYDRYKEQFRQPASARLRPLVVYMDRGQRRDTREALSIAKEIVKRMKSGIPFSQLMKRYSEAPGLNAKGVLDPAGGRPLPMAFLAAPVQAELTKAKEGQVMGPVFLSNSIVFYEVVSLYREHILSFADVQKHIAGLLRQMAARDAFDQWVGRLRTEARIRKF